MTCMFAFTPGMVYACAIRRQGEISIPMGGFPTGVRQKILYVFNGMSSDAFIREYNAAATISY